MPRPKKKTESPTFPSDSPELILGELEKLGCKIRHNIDDLRPEFFIPTGLFGFDRAVSDVGGFPSNSIVEIWGPNSTGKTSVALHIAAQAQEMGMKVFYVNSERAINDSIARIFLKEAVEWIDPVSGEVALDTIKLLLKSYPKCLVINDSIPGCQPSAIADGNVGDSHMAVQARMFSQFMPAAQHYCKSNNSVLIQLNQERANPNGRAPVTCGGNAVPFYSDIRIRLTKAYEGTKPKDILVGGDIVGHTIAAKVVKTRFTAPFQIAELPLVYGAGFDIGRETLTCAELYGVVNKAGSWYSYTKEGETEPQYKVQGNDKMAAWIRQNPDVQQEIVDRMKVLLG